MMGFTYEEEFKAEELLVGTATSDVAFGNGEMSDVVRAL